jgi:2-phosphosulfolactate phosphatase
VNDAQSHVFDQAPYRCRLEWGRRGAREAAERGDAVVIVDAISFSSAVATAAAHGVMVYPCPEEEDAAALAERVEAELAVRRADVPERGRFSLSPLTFVAADGGTRVVLPSPNGSTCTRLAQRAPYVFAGSFLNAAAVGAAVTEVIGPTQRCVTVVPCGERWKIDGGDGVLRPCMEDFVAGGAIIASTGLDKSPEALAAEGAFLHVKDRLEQVLLECASGRELRAIGREDEILHDARLNLYDAVPELRGDRYERM